MREKSNTAEHKEWQDKTQHLSGDSAIQKVRSLLKEFRSGMMLTQSNGSIHTRPMGLQKDASEFDGTLWFFTGRNTRKVEEISENHSISIIFQSDSNHAYLHLFGSASVANNREKMKELYTPFIKTWFPEGLDDPQLTLLRFEADHGDFWDSPGGMLQVLGAFTKSLVTGTPGKGGESGDVRL